MFKHVYGPLRTPKRAASFYTKDCLCEIFLVWKVFRCLGDDDSLEAILLILVTPRSMTRLARLEKWMACSSWKDICWSYMRRDKVCLFLPYCWIFRFGGMFGPLRWFYYG